jgi:hypothetical protein
MPASKIAPEIRAKAIADLLDGDQPAVVAERYGLNAAKVRVWKQRYVTHNVTESITPTATARPANERAALALGDLVLDNLRAKLLATQKIAEYVTTPAWLQKQNAADVAELFTTIDRAAVAILDRMASGRRNDADAPDREPDAD